MSDPILDKLDAFLKAAEYTYQWGGGEDEDGSLSAGPVDFKALRIFIVSLLAEVAIEEAEHWKILGEQPLEKVKEEIYRRFGVNAKAEPEPRLERLP